MVTEVGLAMETTLSGDQRKRFANVFAELWFKDEQDKMPRTDPKIGSDHGLAISSHSTA
jgi:hypothetical protein